MRFDTKIWHPNISSQTGAICLDILKNEWSPALGIRTALLSLQALMCAPEPSIIGMKMGNWQKGEGKGNFKFLFLEIWFLFVFKVIHKMRLLQNNIWKIRKNLIKLQSYYFYINR
jgi:hypothetical protein